MSKSKMRCQKNGHKLNPVQFICTYSECKQIRPGCFLCFPDHDGHTRQNLEIDDFFEKVQHKLKQVESDYLQLINPIHVKKYKENLVRQLQSQFKQLYSKVFQYIDRHSDSIANFIQHKNFTDYGQQIKLKAFHDELERIKMKSTQQLDHKDIHFLQQFILTDEFDITLQTSQNQRDQLLNEFGYEMNQMYNQFDFQFTDLMGQLDQWAAQNCPPVVDIAKTPVVTTPVRQNQNKSRSPFRTPKSQSKQRTPETSQKKQQQKQISQQQKLLITTPDQGRQDFIDQDRDLELFIQYLQMNYLKEDYLNDNLQFLKQSYPQIFDYNKITQKDKISIIYEQKSQLLYLLWDNCMLEWLKHNLPLNTLQIKVHEIDENYNSFLELFDKSLKIHEIVVWLIKQKLCRPKIEYQTWLIFGQKNTQTYRLYHIKSAAKKSYKDLNYYDDGDYNNDYRNNSVNTLPKILQDHLNGDFQIARDLKILVKGLNDPNFQTYLLAERLQIYLNLVTNGLATSNLQLLTIERNFDQVLINFKQFIHYLNLSIKDTNEL